MGPENAIAEDPSSGSQEDRAPGLLIGNFGNSNRSYAVGGSATALAVTLRALGNMGDTTELVAALLDCPSFQTPEAPNRQLRNSYSNLRFQI